MNDKPAQRSYSETQRIEAFELYLAGQHTLGQIAVNLDIPENTIKQWHYRRKWRARRESIELRIREEHEQTIEGIIAEAQPKVLKRHLEVGSKLEEGVSEALDRSKDEDDPTPLSPADLLNLGKTFNQSASITGRAIGLHRNLMGNNSTLVLNAGGVVQVGTRSLGRATDDDAHLDVDYVSKGATDMSAFEDD